MRPSRRTPDRIRINSSLDTAKDFFSAKKFRRAELSAFSGEWKSSSHYTTIPCEKDTDFLEKTA
jgi:hypothetical protein